MNIGSADATWQVAECMLPGINQAVAEALSDQVRAALARSASPVAFLGSLLMPEDEVLLCLFAGPLAEVRAISEQAGLPFERILRCVGLRWTTHQRHDREKGQPQ
jgi:hypothetical protein